MSHRKRYLRGRARAWWVGWRGEVAMVGLACSLVLLAFPTVAFAGRTFSTSWRSVGVDGVKPPPPDIGVPPDRIRHDPGASSWQFEPWAEVTSRSWHGGNVPLWNPYQGMGTPHAANFQSAVFDPLLAPVNLHPTPLVWDLCFFLAFFLGAAAMYLFLRQRGLDRLPSLVGTAPFILSGYFFIYSNNHFFRSYLYLPVLLLLADRTVRSRRVFAPVALGFAVAGNLLVGMPETSVFVLGTLALYCLFLLAFPPMPTPRSRALLRFGGAAALGLALAAPLLLPAMEYLPISFSVHEPSHKLGLFRDPPRLLLNLLMPYALGEPNGNFQGTGFSGTRNWIGAASALAVVGALASPRTLRRQGGWFFFLVGAAILAKAYGLPALRWVGELPVLVRTNIPIFAAPVAAFCAAVLVGIGIQGLLNADVRRRWFLLLTGVFLAGVWVLVGANRPFFTGAPDGHLLRQFGLAALGAGAVAGGFVLRPRAGRILVTVAVLGELLLLAPRGFQVERVDPFVRPPWLEYVHDHVAASRERVFATGAKLFPNTAGAYGIQDIRSLDALYPDRYVAYVKHFIQPRFHDRFLGGPHGQAGEQTASETYDNPMFDLMGVRYVITGGQVPGSALLEDFFSANPPSDLVRPSVFDIGGDRRRVFFVHSGAKATLSVPQGAAKLAFAFALDPQAFADPAADGVDALVLASGGGAQGVLWSATLVPGEAPVRPEWREVSVDLPSGVPSVDLVVNPRSNMSTDWAGFADLRFAESGSSATEAQYRRVASSDGADVYENSRRIPRALVVHEVAPVRDQADALRFFESVSRRRPSGALDVDRFDPSRQAVVEVLPPSAARRIRGCSTPGLATIRSYDADDVVLDVTTSCPGVVLLTDLYYPGWEARVNGRSATIHPTDVAFRGVLVDAGQSTVEFHYRPRSFQAGAALALIGALAAGGALVLSWFRCRRLTPRPSAGEVGGFVIGRFR